MERESISTHSVSKCIRNAAIITSDNPTLPSRLITTS